jgi:hypothetical protein
MWVKKIQQLIIIEMEQSRKIFLPFLPLILASTGLTILSGELKRHEL